MSERWVKARYTKHAMLLAGTDVLLNMAHAVRIHCDRDGTHVVFLADETFGPFEDEPKHFIEPYAGVLKQ